MYSNEDLNNEVNDAINSLMGNGVISAKWVTHEIINRHPVEDGHAKLCQYHYTRSVVGKCMAKAEKKSARMRNDEQIEFMGHEFTYVQDAYVVQRDDDDVMVALSELTYIELMAKANTLMKESDAKRNHADELFYIADIIGPPVSYEKETCN